jgi:adenosylcobinamide amidohydrolase
VIIKEHPLVGGGLAAVTADYMRFSFSRPRLVLSTSEYNGGITRLGGLFNQKLPPGIISAADLPGGSLTAYFARRAGELAIIPASGLLTSARMQCYGQAVVSGGGLVVQAFATGGVDGNAARAGERPQYRETARGFVPLGGTINLFVFLSFALPPGLLAKALITLTEAKSALLAELGVFSAYGDYTATGTGTDGAAIAIDEAGPRRSDAGTHAEVGYMLAAAARQAIAAALRNECYWGAGSQLSAIRVLEKLAADQGEREFYLAKFRRLSCSEQAQVTEGLAVWHVARERRAWQGWPDGAWRWLRAELVNRYPALSDWLPPQS